MLVSFLPFSTLTSRSLSRRVLADDHALVDLPAGLDDHRPAVLQVPQRVGHRLALHRSRSARRCAGRRSRPCKARRRGTARFIIAVPRVSVRSSPLVADQAARRRVEDEARRLPPGGPHLDHARPCARTSSATTTPECSSSTSMTTSSTGSSSSPVLVLLRRPRAGATRRARSPRGAWSRSARRAAARRGRRPRRSPCRRFLDLHRDVALGLAQQAVADDAALSPCRPRCRRAGCR